jgi:hypothetical protein
LEKVDKKINNEEELLQIYNEEIRNDVLVEMYNDNTNTNHNNNNNNNNHHQNSFPLLLSLSLLFFSLLPHQHLTNCIYFVTKKAIGQ